MCNVPWSLTRLHGSTQMADLCIRAEHKGLANTSARFDALQCISMQLWQLHSITLSTNSAMESCSLLWRSCYFKHLRVVVAKWIEISLVLPSFHEGTSYICLGHTAPAFVCSIISSGTPRRASCNCACASCLGIQSEHAWEWYNGIVALLSKRKNKMLWETWISYLAGSDPHDAAENLVVETIPGCTWQITQVYSGLDSLTNKFRKSGSKKSLMSTGPLSANLAKRSAHSCRASNGKTVLRQTFLPTSHLEVRCL